MRMFLIKLLMRLTGGYDVTVKKPSLVKVEQFLLSLASDDVGYKDYYTERKRHILQSMARGLEEKEYWINMGRLQELQFANGLSVQLIKKDRKDLLKHDKDTKEE